MDDDYRHLTAGGTYHIELTQDEACTVLRIHDYGVNNVTTDDLDKLNIVIAKLKDQIWP